MLTLLRRGSNSPLPHGFWGKFKAQTPKANEANLQQPPQMAVSAPRLLTLAFSEMETIRRLPNSFSELDHIVRDWLKPPPDAVFGLRVPVEYASWDAARVVSGPYIWLNDEESYQIAIHGVRAFRVEIVSDGPPPEEEPPAPPPPPVLEMPATFSLELAPGQTVALDTIVSNDELDMARMEDGTTVDGSFWGKLDIVHQGDTHKMEFSGTRLVNQEEIPADVMVDARLISKLFLAAKPPTAKCNLSILAPSQQYCDVVLTFSPYWKLGLSHPPAEAVSENKVKYFVRVHPGGALEHFESLMITTALYYEATPDPGMLNPQEFISPRNGFAMSLRDFVPHIMSVLDQLGMSIHARTTFVNTHIASFSQHKNIAYRFMTPRKIANAIDISVTAENCIFTRLFLMFRGVSEDEMGDFSNAGEKEANGFNWREHIDWSELSKDPSQFRVLETSVLEVT
ncbi:hypothetical protein K474DRAFT_1705147 [Panus rudis PR-1116 ss-1]|nr:hypothetical protein K474DRAFT_1705147 [Panus rudis PR-1116 ss-1]